MSTDSPEAPHALPDRPDLPHLKNQAKDLVKSGAAESISAAQFAVARSYGFASWPKLKAHVDSVNALADLERAGEARDARAMGALMARHGHLEAVIDERHGAGTWLKMKAYVARESAFGPEVVDLKRAIDTEDIDRIKALMTANPDLHRAPLGYGRNGPLTWVAECRVPARPPTAARLAMATWMIDNGSDVHQGGDGPLMRAALNGDRVPMMELLVARGADVNALWDGRFPIIFAPCEAVAPLPLKWLLDHGATPNCADSSREFPGTALDYVIGSYGRSLELGACIDILRSAGGTTKFDIPVVLDLLRGRLDLLREHLRADPALVNRRFPTLDFGTTGGRALTLAGATLLHIAAEYQRLDALKLLLELGADVNARATIDDRGVGGQTALFHAATQFGDDGLEVARLLIDRGAHLSIRAKIPGHYERPGEVVECTPLGYALEFKDVDNTSDKIKTVELLRERGAVV